MVPLPRKYFFIPDYPDLARLKAIYPDLARITPNARRDMRQISRIKPDYPGCYRGDGWRVAGDETGFPSRFNDL